MLKLSISYWDLIKFPYFADTTERGDKGRKQAQRQSDFPNKSIATKCLMIYNNVLAKTSGSQAFWFQKSFQSRWTHTAGNPLLVQAETCNFELYKQPVFTLCKALGREFTPCNASSGPGLNCRVPRALPYTSKTDLSFSSYLQVQYITNQETSLGVSKVACKSIRCL
jgi:hypothetical protein